MSKIIKVILLLFIIDSNVCLALLWAAKPVWVHNSLKEIDACEGKVKLSLEKVWGDDNSSDENEFFRFPYDIKVSQDGLYYILDSGNHRIQVFDKSGKFKRTISRRGQGPADLLKPLAFSLDSNGDLIVFDFGNSRIQTLSSTGNYIKSFKTPHSVSMDIFSCKDNKTAVSFADEFLWSNSIITIFDAKGIVERKIGKQVSKPAASTEDRDIPFIFIDSQDNFYLGYKGIPFYQKYSFLGESLSIVTYETPFESTGVKVNESLIEPVIGKRIPRLISVDIALDRQNRVYLVMAKREAKKSEIYFLVSNTPYDMKRVTKIESENTDRFKLLVFNSQGKIMATCQLDVFCNNLYIDEDRLFIVDSYIGMKIYQYKITFN